MVSRSAVVIACCCILALLCLRATGSVTPPHLVDTNPRYGVMFHRIQGVLDELDAMSTGAVVTTRIGGETYRCVLPPEPDAAPMQGSSEDATQPDGVSPSLISYLDNLRATCLYRIEGWWTYEFCYGRHVVQMHQEGQVVQTSNTLGEWVQGRSVLEPVDGADYVKETYYDGSVCDMTGQPRQIEVRYRCAQDADATNYIRSLSEDATCTYSINVDTQHLCHHPAYRRETDVVLGDIVCELVPQDNDDEDNAQPQVAQLPDAEVSSEQSSPPQPQQQQQHVNAERIANVQRKQRGASRPDPAPAQQDHDEL